MQPTLTGRNRQQEVGPAGNERPRAVIANLARSMGIRTAARTLANLRLIVGFNFSSENSPRL